MFARSWISVNNININIKLLTKLISKPHDIKIYAVVIGPDPDVHQSTDGYQILYEFNKAPALA